MIKNLSKNIRTFLRYQQSSLNTKEYIRYDINKNVMLMKICFNCGESAVSHMVSALDVELSRVKFIDMLPNCWPMDVLYQAVEAMYQYSLILLDKEFMQKNLRYSCYVSPEKIRAKLKLCRN